MSLITDELNIWSSQSTVMRVVEIMYRLEL